MASPRPLLIPLALALCSAGCSVVFDPSDLARGGGGAGATASTTTTGVTSTVTATTDGSTARSTGSGAGPCDGETCSGRGTCDDASGVAVCVCEPHFAGDHCAECNVAYQGPACAACAPGYQDENDDGTCALACTPETCAGNGVCRDDSGDAVCSCDPRFDGSHCETPCAPGTAGADCAYRIVLGMDVPATAAWVLPEDLPYDIDETGSAGAFTRIAYRFVLDDEQVWVEMDAFTDEPTMLGIPVDWIWQADVSNVLVTSLAGAVDTVTAAQAGNVELWNECYDEGPDGAYDAHDIHDGDIDCYGSFQIHVEDRTVIALNAWTGIHAHVDIGIGQAPSGNPDWTFASNGADYTDRRLEVYVK